MPEGIPSQGAPNPQGSGDVNVTSSGKRRVVSRTSWSKVTKHTETITRELSPRQQGLKGMPPQRPLPVPSHKEQRDRQAKLNRRGETPGNSKEQGKLDGQQGAPDDTSTDWLGQVCSERTYYWLDDFRIGGGGVYFCPDPDPEPDPDEDDDDEDDDEAKFKGDPKNPCKDEAELVAIEAATLWREERIAAETANAIIPDLLPKPWGGSPAGHQRAMQLLGRIVTDAIYSPNDKDTSNPFFAAKMEADPRDIETGAFASTFLAKVLESPGFPRGAGPERIAGNEFFGWERDTERVDLWRQLARAINEARNKREHRKNLLRRHQTMLDKCRIPKSKYSDDIRLTGGSVDDALAGLWPNGPDLDWRFYAAPYLIRGEALLGRWAMTTDDGSVEMEQWPVARAVRDKAILTGVKCCFKEQPMPKPLPASVAVSALSSDELRVTLREAQVNFEMRRLEARAMNQALKGLCIMSNQPRGDGRTQEDMDRACSGELLNAVAKVMAAQPVWTKRPKPDNATELATLPNEDLTSALRETEKALASAIRKRALGTGWVDE